MPIMLVSCTCGGVESLLRGTLKKVEGIDWLNVPIHKGKTATRKAITTLPKAVQEDPSIRALLSTIQHKSKYAVVIGYTDSFAIWSDVASGRTKDKIDAQVIAEKYYGN